MTLIALLSLVLMGCASAPETPTPSYEYGGLRQPAELQPKIEQAQPVVPPAAKPEEPPRADPCTALCALDRECDRLSESCQKMFEEQGHMNGSTCQKKDRVCKGAISNQSKINACNC